MTGPEPRCSALETAGAIINYCLDLPAPRRRTISNLQLQKILYFLQLLSIQLHGTGGRLIFEDFEAWCFGPVVRKVYAAYRYRGGLPIYDRQIITADPIAGQEPYTALIERALRARPFELVILSHVEGGAWDQT